MYFTVYLLKNNAYRVYTFSDVVSIIDSIKGYEEKEFQPKKFNNLIETVMYLAKTWDTEPTKTYNLFAEFTVDHMIRTILVIYVFCFLF